MKVSIIVLGLVFISTNIGAIECQKPPIPIDGNESMYIEASIGKVLGLVNAGEMTTEAKRSHFDVLQKYPNADRLLVELHHIYMFCTALRDSKSISDNEKLERLNIFISATKDANIQFSKVPKSDEQDPSIVVAGNWYNLDRQYKLLDGNVVLQIIKIYEYSRKHVAEITIEIPHRKPFTSRKFGYGDRYNKLRFNYRKRDFEIKFIDIDIDEQRLNFMLREVF